MSLFRIVRPIVFTALAAVGLLGFVDDVRADPGFRSDLESTALHLQHEVRQLDRQVEANFRFTPHYERLTIHTQEMQRLAHHIAVEARTEHSLHHLRADVERLERLYNLVRVEVEALGRNREIDRRAYFHIEAELEDVHTVLRQLDRELDRCCESRR